MNFSAAVLVSSDRAAAGIYEDKSGKILVDLLKEMGFEVKKYQVIPDDYEQIKNKLSQLRQIGIVQWRCNE